MKRNKLLALSVGVALTAMALFAPTSFAEKPTVWKMQTFWSSGELAYKCLQDFTDRVHTMTDGRLKIVPHAAGTLVPTFEALDAIKVNIIQAMNMGGMYFTGKEPAFSAISDLIAAWNNPREAQFFFYHRGGLDLLNELYEPFGVVSIGIVMHGLESLVAKHEIRTPEDFKGNKFRSAQGMGADLFRRLGATVVVLPGEEAYSALDKGVVDGLDWSTPSMNHRMGFDRIAKYFIWPGIRSMPVSDFSVNKNEWEKLPEDMKQMLKSAVREWNIDQLARLHIDDIKAIREMKEQGCTQITWSEENRAEVRKVARQMWEDWKEKSPMSRKVIEAQMGFLRELGRIE